MDFMTVLRGAGSKRRCAVAISVAILAPLTMAMASPAQAHTPSLAKAWGSNRFGQLGVGTHAGPQKCGPPEMEQACSTTPVAVSGLSGVTALAAGTNVSFSNFALALLE